MSTALRLLQPGDEPAALEFLGRHGDSSMILWSNLLAAGLVDRGARYQGTWVALYQGTRITGVAMHAWNGHLIVQAEQGAAELARLAAQQSGRRVLGLLGPWEQALAAREALGLASAPTRVCENEVLFALDLAELRLPAPMLETRAPREDDLDVACSFRAEYARELNLEPVEPARLREATRASASKGDIFITTDGGAPVSITGVNARLPDRLQVGGVYTPPALRGRGYARCAVAGHLAFARAAGAVRATLFTREGNFPAQACYRALGFVPVGRYALILFEVTP